MSRSTVLRAILLVALLAALAAFINPSAAADDTVSTVDLIDNMKKYDGRQVTIEGEVVGDVMVRGTHAWITVNDDRYSKKSVEEGGELIGMSNAGLGVWVSDSQVKLINVCGGYKKKGDIVRVTGVFHRACEEHGGDADIHATSLDVIREGYAFTHPFYAGKFIALLILMASSAGLWTINIRKKKAGFREAKKE